jgi:hypothetical protein
VAASQRRARRVDEGLACRKKVNAVAVGCVRAVRGIFLKGLLCKIAKKKKSFIN